MKKSALFCAALMLLSIGALAKPPKHATHAKKASHTKAVKLVDVWTCPMTLQKTDAKDQGGTPVVVGKYRVHFCCGSCGPSFAKLDKKEQLAKAEAAYKKDLAGKKDAKKS